MDLKEAIIHARQVAEGCAAGNRDCAYQHDQLADWLEELEEYKRTGLTPEEIRALQTAFRDIEQGRYIKLPFVAMVEQSLKGGKMTPQKDQSHNGRYAVVYSDPKKWKSPLIDICGKHYDREEAEARMEELLEGGKE